MSWQLVAVAEAVAAVLAGLDPAIAVFDQPPSTLNPPAYVVGLPTTVEYDLPTFGVDLAELPVSAVCGAGEFDRVATMIDTARGALRADPSLANTPGVVMSQRPRSSSGWRMWTSGGIDVLSADLILEIRA